MSKKSLTIAAIVAAATIGEGVFAVPYIIATAGWAITLGYFIAVIAIVSVAHILYLRTLAAVDEKERLLGLARKYFGATGFWIGFIAIVVGLLLGFVAYLVLGTQFLQILFPALPSGFALAIFWILLACLVWGSEGRIAWFEGVGIALVSFAILFIFFSGHPAAFFNNVPFAVPGGFLLPFGASLFSHLRDGRASSRSTSLRIGAMIRAAVKKRLRSPAPSRFLRSAPRLRAYSTGSSRRA